MGKDLVEFFYDVGSPYSLLAFETLLRLQSDPKWNFTLQLRPVAAGYIFFEPSVMEDPAKLAQIRTGANGIERKGRTRRRQGWQRQDIARNAATFNVPIRNPEDVTLLLQTYPAMCILTAIQKHKPQYLLAATREFFHCVWVHHRGFSDLVTPLKNAHMTDSDIQFILEKRKDKEIKSILHEAVDDAVKRGAFGVPTIFVTADSDKPNKTTQMYWGSDRFYHIGDQLNKPFDHNILKAPLAKL